MISTQLEQAVPGFDEVITEEAPDFVTSGLKRPSVVRLGRLAVASPEVLLGAIGEVSEERLTRIRRALAEWILGSLQ